MKISYFLLFLYVLSSCKYDQVDSVKNVDNIPNHLSERITQLGLISPQDSVIAAIYRRSLNIPLFETTDRNLVLLTDQRFFRYFTYSSGEEEVQQVDFNNCLDIKIDSSFVSKERIIYDMSAKTIYQLLLDEDGEILHLLPDFAYIHYGENISYQEDLYALNSLIFQTWRSHKNYDSLRIIYTKFYDSEGNKKIAE